MPRNNRTARGGKKVKTETGEAELRLEAVRSSVRRTVTRRGVDYVLQNVGGKAQSDKSWMCPYCNVEIKTGTPHVVIWDYLRGVDTRRHFHTSCSKSFEGPLL